MIEILRHHLEEQQWQVKPHHILREPDMEIDIYSFRSDTERIILQLKSLVRPMTPREVRRRNEDIICGINHTAAVVSRLPGAVGFVITNGYRGDYATWKVALRHNVTIGTVEDIREVTTDPIRAIDALKARVGFKQTSNPTPTNRPARFRLARWNIELTT
ncbi:MAG: hypothetical protein ACREQX_00020 [Candidatus Binataceae bacterium]